MNENSSIHPSNTTSEGCKLDNWLGLLRHLR